MTGPDGTPPAPGHHTPEGGVLVGRPTARHRMIIYEDPQCPYCGRFEASAVDLVLRAVADGALAVEYIRALG